MTSGMTNSIGSNALLRGIQVLELVDDIPRKLNDARLETSSAVTATAQQKAGEERGTGAVIREGRKRQPLSKQQQNGGHESKADRSDQRTSVERSSSRNLEARKNSKAPASHMTLNKEHLTDSQRNISDKGSQRNLADKEMPKRNAEVKKRNQLLEESKEGLFVKKRDVDAQLSLIRTSGKTSDRQISDSRRDLKKEIRNSGGESSSGKTKEQERKLSLDVMEKLDVRRKTREQTNSANSSAAKSRKERSSPPDKTVFRMIKSDNDQIRSGSVTATRTEFNNGVSLVGKDGFQHGEKQSRTDALSVEMQARKRASRLSKENGQASGIEVNKTKSGADPIINLDKESRKSTNRLSDDVGKPKRKADPKENAGIGTRGTMKVTKDGIYGIRSENTRIGNDATAKTETNSHDLMKRRTKIKPEVKKEDAEGGLKEQETKIKKVRSSAMKVNGQITMQPENNKDDVYVNPKIAEKKLRVIDKTESKKMKVPNEDRVYTVATVENEVAEEGRQKSTLSKYEVEGNDTLGVRRDLLRGANEAKTRGHQIVESRSSTQRMQSKGEDTLGARREVMRSANETKTSRHEIVDSQSSEQTMKLKGVMTDEKSNLKEHHSEPVRKIRRTKDAGDKLKKITVREEHGLNKAVSEKYNSEQEEDKDVTKEHSSVDLKRVDLTEEQKLGKDLRKTKLVKKPLSLEDETEVKQLSKDVLVGCEKELRLMKESQTILKMNGDDSNELHEQKVEHVNDAKNNWNSEEKSTTNDMFQSLQIDPELEEGLISGKKAMKVGKSVTKQRLGNTVNVNDAKKVHAKETKELMMKEPEENTDMKAGNIKETAQIADSFWEQADSITDKKVSRISEEKGMENTEMSNSCNVDDLLTKRPRSARKVEKPTFLVSAQISAGSIITEETELARCGLAANPLGNHQLESLVVSGSQSLKGENVEPSKINKTGASKQIKSFVQNLSLYERKDSQTQKSEESIVLAEHDSESTSSDEIVEDIQSMDCDDNQSDDDSEQKILNLHATATGHCGPCTQTKTAGPIIARKETQKVARKLDFDSELLLPMKTVLFNYPESPTRYTTQPSDQLSVDIQQQKKDQCSKFGKRHLLTPTAFDISMVSKCLAEASLKRSRARVTKRVQRRFEDLQQIIEFDIWNMEIFHLPPLTEYALYMRIYGMSNARQAYTQTGEENVSTEVQTDDVHLRNKWCQHPDHAGMEQDERDFSKVPLWNSEHLSKFLLNVGKVIESLLEETAMQQLDFTQSSSPETAAFSDGCIELGLVSFLKGRHVISGQFSASESQFLLLVYSQPTQISEDEKLSRKGLICLWNLSTPDKPVKVLVSEAEPLCCCLSPAKPTVAFAGMNDGTLSVWDMRESSFLHMSCRDNTEECVLRRPTFNTVALLNQDNHSSPVVSVAPILGPTGHRNSRQDTDIPVDGKDECLAFQLATLEIDAVIVFWAVTEMTKPKEVTSEADFCLSPGGRIRLTKTRMITLEIPAIIRTKRWFSHQQKVFEKAFHALSFQLLPYNNSHYYVATDVGCIIHGLRYGGRTNPNVHSYKMDLFTEVTSLNFCPFDQSYFLAGHRDGSVSLYTTQQMHPVTVWRNTTKNFSPILAVHFSYCQPGTFFVLDDNSYLYTWNLLESTDSPVNQEHLSHSRVTHICVSTHTKVIGSGLECRQPHMAIFTESGTCSIRKFSERLSNFSSSDVDDFKLKLRSIS